MALTDCPTWLVHPLLQARTSAGRITELTISPPLPDLAWTDEQVATGAVEVRLRHYAGNGRPVVLLERGRADVSRWDASSDAARRPGLLETGCPVPPRSDALG
jgi:hypothetical protein